MKAITLRLFAILFVIASAAIVVATEKSEVSFNRDVRPILSNYCFGCHGPDKHGRQADLRLDDRTAALESDAFSPGDASASSMIERILSPDPESVMPPPKAGKSLAPQEIAILKQWIDEGAVYQSHWAFIPVPKDVPVPQVLAPQVLTTKVPVSKLVDTNESETSSPWARSDLDRFIHHQLRGLRIEPAVEATRERWLRRVSLDLTGLPPTITELDQFSSDTSEHAYERVVDRLLSSDAYGERMANMWLDVSRYADTFGYQSDIDMDVWPWRDWVIRAFNENLPYDQFVLWQTAGDLLPDATLDQRLATTFNRLHRQTNEGGSIEEEFRQVYIADRTATNATAFLGMTFECARCHDHKYDPILQKDFYQLASYFANIDEHGLYSHFTKTSPTPTLLIYEDDQEKQHQDSLSKIKNLQGELEQTTNAARDRFLKATSSDAITPPSIPVADLDFPLEGDVEGVAEGVAEGVVGKAMQFNGDDAYVCEKALQYGRNTPISISMWIKPAAVEAGGAVPPYQTILHQSVAAEDSAFRGLQLVLRNGRPEFSLIHFWPGNAIRVTANEALARDAWTHLTITYDGSSSASGVSIYVNGSAVKLDVIRDQLTRDILHRAEWHDSSPGAAPLALGARFRDVGFRDGCLDQLQIYHRRLSSWEAAMVADRSSELKVTDQMKWNHFIINVDADSIAANKKLLDARQEENELVSQVRQIMTMKTAVVPRSMHLLLRGSYESPGELVEADTPSFLAKTQAFFPQDRLSLAKWMIDDQNPLVSRVTVNRFWHLFFGRGLVASLDDFGNQGQPPTHPELLDWLARRFMDQGWDTKQLCREIVLSSVYRQSSVPRDLSLFESDPDNKLLARGPRHRLSAEQVRDTVLTASGLLVRTIGGPSVMPYQPAGLWEEAGTNKHYAQAKGDGLYRRSLYTFWRRTAPPPSMLTFDATSRETCTAKRELTATPLQALILLNDPQYVEAARVLAQNLIANYPNDLDQRWRDTFRRLTSRNPSDRELDVLRKLYAEQFDYFTANPDSAKSFVAVGEKPIPEAIELIDLAATSVLVETVISFDETITKR